MTSSPDLIHELKASRPAAPVALRARVRELAAQEAAPAPSAKLRFRLPARRFGLVALPAAAALALTTAGVLGIARSDGPTAQTLREEQFQADDASPEKTNVFGTLDTTDSSPLLPVPAPEAAAPTDATGRATDQLSAIAPTDDRKQRVSATLTVEVADSDGVSSAAQEALDLTRRLGGHVVSASVATGEEGTAALVVRVPVTRVQEAIVQLSGLGSIVSQQVTIDDLQETIDALQRRERSVRSQIAVVVARLDSESLDATTRARLEARLKNLRAELRGLRRGVSATNAEARMATVQFAVVTPGSQGVVPASSKLDRTLDEALNVLVWEGVIAIAILIVAAPFALVALAAWLGRRLYRRREEDRLLAT